MHAALVDSESILAQASLRDGHSYCTDERTSAACARASSAHQTIGKPFQNQAFGSTCDGQGAIGVSSLPLGAWRATHCGGACVNDKATYVLPTAGSPHGVQCVGLASLR